MAAFWQAPTDLTKRDVFTGEWGRERAPDPQAVYTFARRKRHGTSPGMVVTDPTGRRWHVKQGREGPPEVVVSRILSAIGYHQPPEYYLQSFAVWDDPSVRLERGGRFRLVDSALKIAGTWSWDDNPFIGTQPFQGLLVILVMLNSADLKNSNNVLYRIRKNGHGTDWYVVRDLGTSLGETVRFNPRPDDLYVFERQRFITGMKNGYVAFDYGAVHAGLVRHTIRPHDVRWASQLLGGLTDRQWHDAFRAGGYEPAIAERFIRRIRQKIEDGRQVSFQPSVP